ncbi:MAG: potassium-transporting ATPase subunit KdpA [Desulfobacterales bacterium]|nr:potassium-transporting ATPase subunit KdpA [Desulfobacterales bacterium]MBF0396762.1 potassium-transporting ATPase subunit KdpA [Desulfobacterales bacterium]
MTIDTIIQIGFYMFTLLCLVKPLGYYMAKVYQGKFCKTDGVFGIFERGIYRFCGIDLEEDMAWQKYALSVLWFSFVSIVFLYILQRLQNILPLNPQKFSGISSDSSFNTAISFVTNTNWQGYSAEISMSYLTQMIGLGVQNFLSAAVGMSVLVALIRGFVRCSEKTIGNFWVDLTRTVLYILIPLSIILAVLLVSEGVIQNFNPYKKIQMIENPEKIQILPMGPAASQISIKQLGTNGGGFFNVNSAHPFENPTPFSNFLEMLAILIIPSALCYTFGFMVFDTKQGWALFTAMMIIFIPMLFLCCFFEQQGNPNFDSLSVDQKSGLLQSGGNMEGKEVRFGITNSAIWATATTAASNGSVNSMHDSYSPLGGTVPLLLIQLGEIIFGGAGSGLYGMIVFAIIAVFAAGLMVGRTPEYLGKKIEPFEMKMSSLVIIIPAALTLLGTAVSVITKNGVNGISNPGPHGFTEVLYAFSSAANNNGSSFAGLSSNTVFYNIILAIAMFLGRFGIIIPVLAIAGSLARKKHVPVSSGTLPTSNPLFILLLVGVIILIGALTFFPSIALGPIAEQVLSK